MGVKKRQNGLKIDGGQHGALITQRGAGGETDERKKNWRKTVQLVNEMLITLLLQSGKSSEDRKKKQMNFVLRKKKSLLQNQWKMTHISFVIFKI